jgi:hypothetical protein
MLRLAATVAVMLCALSFAACDDDDNEVAPIAVEDRLLTTADVPDGYSVAREFTWDTAEGVRDDGLGTTTIQASPDEAYDVVRNAGFKAGAGRVFERNDATEPADFIVVIVLQLGSSDGAGDVLDFSADDSEKPCPETCAFTISETDIEGIPNARGVRRIATQETIEATGGSDGPGEVRRVAFTDGPFFYYINAVHTPPSETESSTAEMLAKRLYERVKGAPAP